MEQIETKLKKWGNSLGVVLPRKVIQKENLREGNELVVTIELSDKTKVKDIFGILRDRLKNVDTKKALKEVDSAFWPDKK